MDLAQWTPPAGGLVNVLYSETLREKLPLDISFVAGGGSYLP
jgi:hypothetical protein